ncbi:Subtilisin-like protease 2 [Plasmodium coatneyi]|uniref:Subtilisin-like protease 2 n=1 Tax=Plasmodium coatneyi TaxID=208452 RepID=A0A1B1E014_9APIC|nr:Subtilisin-like protease 2 [Plasmodium coatneyi]ANQ08368.1 Subtilisin-like protease 2 [Plasmodium coatneyi]
MLSLLYVLPLILMDIFFQNDWHRKKILSELGNYNVKLVRRRSRVLSDNTTGRINFLDGIKEGYKPLFDVLKN